MAKIWQIMRKEWAEVFKNRMVLFTVIFLPLLFTIMPLGILFSMRGTLDTEMAGAADALGTSCAGMSEAVCGQYVLLSQFLMLFLMLPLIIPVTFAAYSIVGEKTTRTLEPVLATPITTVELLLGKALAGVLPALLGTYLSYGVFLLGTLFLSPDTELLKMVAQPMWLLAIFVLGALFSIMGVCMAIMVSSRVNDTRVAEQLSSLVIIPVVGLFMAQSIGKFQVNLGVIAWMVLASALIDGILVYFAVQMFQRETILTRWK